LTSLTRKQTAGVIDVSVSRVQARGRAAGPKTPGHI